MRARLPLLLFFKATLLTSLKHFLKFGKQLCYYIQLLERITKYTLQENVKCILAVSRYFSASRHFTLAVLSGGFSFTPQKAFSLTFVLDPRSNDSQKNAEPCNFYQTL